MNFLRKGFQKLSFDTDRQTDTTEITHRFTNGQWQLRL